MFCSPALAPEVMFLATLYLPGVSKVIAYNDLAGKCMKQAGKDIKEWW